MRITGVAELVVVAARRVEVLTRIVDEVVKRAVVVARNVVVGSMEVDTRALVATRVLVDALCVDFESIAVCGLIAVAREVVLGVVSPNTGC